MVRHDVAAWRVFRAVVAIAGRPVMLRALATGAAVGLPALVVFSPQGLSAHDLLRAMRSPPVALVIWLGWLALSAVATSAVFNAPGTSAVRALRPRRRHLVPALLALASVAQAPWAVLWLRGAGVVAAIGAVLVAVAASASAFALTRRPTLRVALLLAALAPVAYAGAVAGPMRVAFLVAGAALAVLAVLAAWRVAPEARREARVWTRASASPIVALATVHLLRLVRVERLRLLLATMIGSIGAAGLLTLRSDPTPRPGARAVAIMTVPLVLLSALFVTPLLACEEGLRARLRVLRVRHAVVVGAFFMAVASPTTAFAATAGLATGAPVVPLGAWSLALSAMVALWGRRHRTMRRRGPATFAIGVTLIALVTVTLAMELL